MSTEKLSIVQKLNSTPAQQIATIPEVATRFQELYSLMNRANPAAGKLAYETQKFHFMKLLQDKPELQQCTRLSLYGCFLDAAVNGLSFDPAAKHLYVVSFNVNIGTKDDKKWEKRAQLMVAGPGELSMRIRQGQIKYADNPVLVYNGDEFSFGTRSGKFFLDHVAKLPRESDEIIAAYIRLERNDGSSDYKVLTADEVAKLRKFSKDPNSKAWTDGFPGMIQSKTIKHAFRTYPKVQMGNFSTMSSDLVERPETSDAILPDYGLNGDMPGQIQLTDHSEEPTGNTQPPISEDSFAKREQEEQQTGTVVHDSEEF